MKHFLLSATLLLFILGCTKFEAEYAVNCQFAPFLVDDEGILLVTDSNGDVLDQFDIPNRATSFSQKFSFSGKEAPEKYDLHLIYTENQFGTSGTQNRRIISHFDVPNGALVYFARGSSSFSSYRKVSLEISGIESFDSLNSVNVHEAYNEEAMYYPGEKKVRVGLLPNVNQGLLLRLLANNEIHFRHLFIPDSLLKDTLTVAWQDFKPENNLRKIELPGDGLAYSLEVSVVSPDYKHYTALYQNYSGWNGGQEIPAEFNFPDGLTEPATYRIKVGQSGGEFEKIFQPGEPLRFEPADMTIGDVSDSGQRIAVQTSGAIDMIRMEIFALKINDFSNSLSWQLDGKPESFEERVLPRFERYIPDWYYSSSQSHIFRVIKAYQFDKYEYTQVREGFPFKSTDLFAMARSGYKAIWKTY